VSAARPRCAAPHPVNGETSGSAVDQIPVEREIVVRLTALQLRLIATFTLPALESSWSLAHANPQLGSDTWLMTNQYRVGVKGDAGPHFSIYRLRQRGRFCARARYGLPTLLSYVFNRREHRSAPLASRSSTYRNVFSAVSAELESCKRRLSTISPTELQQGAAPDRHPARSQ
jgi:hypothetical protein